MDIKNINLESLENNEDLVELKWLKNLLEKTSNSLSFDIENKKLSFEVN